MSPLLVPHALPALDPPNERTSVGSSNQPASAAGTLRGARRRPEARDEFASAVYAGLREDGLEVILERVAGNGVTGTVTLNLAGSNDSGLNLKATSTIVSATGDLAGLHGTLNLAGSVQIPQGPFGTYSGQIG
jgi:hypothetical protein